MCEGIYWSFLEELASNLMKKLKKGDLAIFWEEKKYATIRIYDQSKRVRNMFGIKITSDLIGKTPSSLKAKSSMND